MSDLPAVFVTGCPRSGTSLMQSLLHAFEGMHGDYNEVEPLEGPAPGLIMKAPFHIFPTPKTKLALANLRLNLDKV